MKTIESYQGKLRNPTGCLPFIILMAFLLFAALANAQPSDTAKVAKPDSVSIRFSLAEYQALMQNLSSAATTARDAKKPSEAATVPVFILRAIEDLEAKAKAVYKTGAKK